MYTGDLKILHKKCPNKVDFWDIIFNFSKILCGLPSTLCLTGELWPLRFIWHHELRVTHCQSSAMTFFFTQYSLSNSLRHGLLMTLINTSYSNNRNTNTIKKALKEKEAHGHKTKFSAWAESCRRSYVAIPTEFSFYPNTQNLTIIFAWNIFVLLVAMSVCLSVCLLVWFCVFCLSYKNSRIWETKHLSTDADSSTDAIGGDRLG